MIYVARIEGGIVSQVVVEPDGYLPRAGEAGIGPANTVGIGWAWDGEAFAPPPQHEEDE